MRKPDKKFKMLKDAASRRFFDITVVVIIAGVFAGEALSKIVF